MCLGGGHRLPPFFAPILVQSKTGAPGALGDSCVSITGSTSVTVEDRDPPMKVRTQSAEELLNWR
jgi:hypothetical protein